MTVNPSQPQTPLPFQEAPDGSSGAHLRDYLRVLYRRRWPAMAIFLVIFTYGAVRTFRATPIYRASARVLIEQDAPAVAGLDELFRAQASSWYQSDFYQTQFQILMSRSLARRTVRELDLARHPMFGGGSGPSQHEPSAGSVGSAGSAGPSASSDSSRSSSIDPELALAGAFLGGLGVQPVGESRVVEVSYTSPDPELAAAAANAHVRSYIQAMEEQRFETSQEATGWLAEQLAEQRTKVEESEQALQRYREQNDAVAVEDRENIVVQRLGALNSEVTRAKTERLAKQAVYEQLRAVQDSGSLETFPSIAASEFVQTLRIQLGELQRREAQLAETLGDRHPDMVAIRADIRATELKLESEIAKVVESVHNEFLTAQAQERSLVSALEAQKREALGLNRKAIEYSVLSREAESNRQIYESLLQRTRETGISGQLQASNIRIVDEALLPGVPISPRVQRDLMLAGLGGLVFAIGIAFFFEYFDNRIKSPDELKVQLGTPFLGMVPQVDSDQPALISNLVPEGFIEAVSTLRTNVLFASAADGLRVVSVTSAGPGEGKSVIASNLALALAQTRQRVLLIDADMRRPRVHEIFELQQEPGLSNLLVHDEQPDEPMYESVVDDLSIIPAGRIPPNPSELLTSRRYADFLRSLETRFDWVIVDSPPVMAVSDAAVVANAATGVVFVVGSDQTSRHAAKAALAQLSAARAQVLGAVLNRVAVTKNPYYYAHYYRKEYSRYYASSATRASVEPSPARRRQPAPATTGAKGGESPGARPLATVPPVPERSGDDRAPASVEEPAAREEQGGRTSWWDAPRVAVRMGPRHDAPTEDPSDDEERPARRSGTLGLS